MPFRSEISTAAVDITKPAPLSHLNFSGQVASGRADSAGVVAGGSDPLLRSTRVGYG